VTLREGVHAAFGMVFNLVHLLLNVVDLRFFSIILSLHFVDLLVQLQLEVGLLLVGKLAKLLVALDFSLNVPVLLLNHVDVTVKHVHVVVK